MKNILFVSHDANRAGAQILLLRFLKLLKNDKHFKFSILLKHGGNLENEFRTVAQTFVYEHRNLTNKKSLLKKFKHKILQTDKFQSDVLKQLNLEKFDLIVSNTIVNGDLMPTLSLLNCPIITYVHELEMGIRQYTTPAYFQNVLKYSSSFIACGEAVKQNLLESHGITNENVKVLPSLLPETSLTFGNDDARNQLLRNQYNIPNDAFVVGGMGTVDIRKGVDIFLQVAKRLEFFKDVYFLWVGGLDTETDYQLFQIDKERLGLENVIFQSSVDNPLDFMSAFDIFFISSREDPYPLVALEAALLEKPIICFDKAGGAKDFVENDCGIVTAYLDVDKASKAIVELMENPVLRKKMGDAARKKVLERHNQEKAFQTFVSILQTNHTTIK